MSNLQIDKLSKDVIEAVREVTDTPIYKIFLYGSYARGDFDEESDVDIMVVFDCDKESVQSFRNRMCYYASLMALDYDKEISILLRDKQTFRDNQQILPFYQNVVKEGIVLYG